MGHLCAQVLPAPKSIGHQMSLCKGQAVPRSMSESQPPPPIMLSPDEQSCLRTPWSVGTQPSAPVPSHLSHLDRPLQPHSQAPTSYP
jgi:hypothetical protein